MYPITKSISLQTTHKSNSGQNHQIHLAHVDTKRTLNTQIKIMRSALSKDITFSLITISIHMVTKKK